MIFRYLTCLLIALVFVTPASSADGPKALSSWITQLQTLAGKHRKGETLAQTEAAFAALKEAIAKEHDGVEIQFIVPINDVTWKDGVATIRTPAEYGKLPAPSAAAPLRLHRTAAFEVRMNQADALAIKNGTRLRFTGRLTFHPGQYGAVGAATKSQQLYEIRHEYLGPHAAGTFTSRDATYQIGGKTYEGRWANATGDGEAGKKEEGEK